MTGLTYLNARTYDAALGRFLSPDWWEVTSPGVGTNRYSYSDNDPINRSDRNGNTWIWDPHSGDSGLWRWQKSATASPGTGSLGGSGASSGSGSTASSVSGSTARVAFLQLALAACAAFAPCGATVSAGVGATIGGAIAVGGTVLAMMTGNKGVVAPPPAEDGVDADGVNERRWHNIRLRAAIAGGGGVPYGSADWAGPPYLRPASRGGETWSAAYGRQMHQELRTVVSSKPGLLSEPTLLGKDGRRYRPDIVTPGGHIIELKPNSASGRAAGLRQARTYEEQLGMRVRVIYYDVP